MKHGRCAVVGRWRGPSCTYVVFFSTSRQRQSRAAIVCVRVYTQRASHCYFLRKWRNDSSSGIASNFARSLAIAKWKPFGRFRGFSVTMPWASHKLRSVITDSKMAARRWIATLVPVGPQKGEITSSLTKCGLWSCRNIVSPSENLRWFVHAESVRETWRLHHDDAPAHSSQLIQTFWPNTTFLWFDRLPTLPTWLLAIFGSSSTWKRHWKGLDLSHETTLYGTRRPSCTPFAIEIFQKCFEQWRNRWEKCVVTRRLLRKGLGLQTSRRVNVFFPAKGRILFEQPS